LSVKQPKAPSRANGRSRKIGLFGGSFDPIHVGHVAVARAAQRRFHLEHVLFIPLGRPPHKVRHRLAPFPHRFAMVALACAGHPQFVPSLAEAGPEWGASGFIIRLTRCVISVMSFIATATIFTLF